MLVVRGAVKEYDWGVVDGLVAWAGERSGRPQAELWFGVHPGGPSPLVDGSGLPTGQNLGDHFDVEQIPILVKLLAAARPLSVQVHPAAGLARSLWETQGGRALVTDPYEKTEMLIALEPFEAFAGWRPAEQAAAILDRLPGCGPAAAAVRAGDARAAIRALLAGARAAVAELPAAVAAAGLTGAEAAAYATTAVLFPQDAGALLTPLLGYVALAPGEAVFVPAGVPHSYISGTGLEVMTSSDNVLRLGLTPKPVHVDEALAALDLSLRPQVVRRPLGSEIAPVGAPFAATLHSTGEVAIDEGRYRIVLLIEGRARVATALADLELHPGSAAVLAAEDPGATVSAEGLVAVVTSAAR